MNNKELRTAIISELMRKADHIRSLTPDTEYITCPVPEQYQRMGPEVVSISLDCRTTTRIVLDLGHARVRLVDALSFLCRHEYRPLDGANKEINRLREENRKFRERLDKIQSRRSPEAVLWNNFMGRS